MPLCLRYNPPLSPTSYLPQVLAGPYCIYQLALLGADVIKIEPPHEGEWTRAQGPYPGLSEQGLGLGFCVQNANKRFLTVNLKDPRGLDTVMQLAATADVLVENFRVMFQICTAQV